MKKVTQALNTLQTLSELVKMQHNEINRLRYIVARYNAKHGEEILGGSMIFNDSQDFQLDSNTDRFLCKIVDHKELGIDSDFMSIQKIINSLNEKP
jgi:ABC-type transporter Mla subunit MlaD